MNKLINNYLEDIIKVNVFKSLSTSEKLKIPSVETKKIYDIDKNLYNVFFNEILKEKGYYNNYLKIKNLYDKAEDSINKFYNKYIISTIDENDETYKEIKKNIKKRKRQITVNLSRTKKTLKKIIDEIKKNKNKKNFNKEKNEMKKEKLIKKINKYGYERKIINKETEYEKKNKLIDNFYERKKENSLNIISYETKINETKKNTRDDIIKYGNTKKIYNFYKKITEDYEIEYLEPTCKLNYSRFFGREIPYNAIIFDDFCYDVIKQFKEKKAYQFMLIRKDKDDDKKNDIKKSKITNNINIKKELINFFKNNNIFTYPQIIRVFSITIFDNDLLSEENRPLNACKKKYDIENILYALMRKNKESNDNDFFKNLMRNYIFISPVSYKNCLIKVFIMYNKLKKGLKIDNKSIINISNKFVKENKINTSTNYLIILKKLIEKFNINARLYMLYEQEIKIYKNNEEDNYVNILVESTHALLMLDKNNKDDKKLNLIDKEIIFNMNEHDKCEIIDKDDFMSKEDKQEKEKDEIKKKFKENLKEINFRELKKDIKVKQSIKEHDKCNNKIEKIENKNIYKLFTFDIETYNIIDNETGNEKRKTYLIGCSNERFKYFFFKKFIDFLNDCKTCKYNQIYIAHNLKFDVAEIYENKKNLNNFDCAIRNKQLYYISFNYSIGNDKYTVKFIDSMNFFNMSLEILTKSNKLYKKQADYDICNINETNLNEKWDDIIKYNMLDVFSLMESMNEFKKNVLLKYNIDVFNNCITSSGLARKIYFNNFYNGDIEKLSYKLNNKISKTYFGGRNEAFIIGKIKEDVIKIDINSSYPFQMLKKIPTIYLKKYKNIKYDKNLFGFMKVMIKTKDFSKVPHIPIIMNNKLCFPHIQEYKKILLFTEDLKYVLENELYEIEDNNIITFHEFTAETIFKNYIEDVYKSRMLSKKNYDEAGTILYKLLMNGLYGGFGIKSNAAYNKFCNKKEFLHALFTGTLTYFKQFDEDNFYVEYEKISHFSFSNMAVASAITSYARIYLHKTIQKIKDSGYNVYYCDTDSIITNMSEEELKKNFNIGSVNLGDWKIENKIKKDEGDIYGLKMYSYKDKKTKEEFEIKQNFELIKTIEDDNIKYSLIKKEDEILKIKQNDYELHIKGMKGIKHFDDEEILKCMNEMKSGEINRSKDQNMTFKCNVKDILKNKGVITYKTEKKIKKIYNKGDVLENGEVKPFII